MFQPKILIAKIIIMGFLLTALSAWGDALKPLETLKPPINKAMTLLNDPKYKTDESLKSEQRDLIWQTVKSVFDFDEISKKALARNWRKFSSDEKKEFADVFGTFLGNKYVDQIQGEYHNEKIIYGDEEIRKEKWARVRTKIKRETIEIPVDYMMKLIDGQWKIYDVVVENVSLISNYREQFRSSLRKETPAQLIERLKKKNIDPK